MKVGVVSLFPELIDTFMQYGIPRKAVAVQQMQVQAINPRDFTTDAHRTVDDRPFGGGPGMVMKVEPLTAALTAAREWAVAEEETAPPEVIYLSPQGERLNQALVRDLATRPSLVLLAGRYEGIDERLLGHEIDRELSIGDYVLSGGEAAAMVLLDSLSRLLPDVLGCAESVQQDSFGEEGLLDHPHYTRPELLDERQVPEVLLSGDHARIRQWRRQQALQRTMQRRPDLLDEAVLTDSDRLFLEQLQREAACDRDQE